MEDGDLIEAYLAGDAEALSTLVDRYLGEVYRFVLRLTKDAAASEDIVQDSFVKAWKHVRGFRRGGDVRSWLFSIARNTAIDWLRRRKDVALSDFDMEDGQNAILMHLSDHEPMPDEVAERAEDARIVTAHLRNLDERYREVLLLRHTSNLTFEEIGALVNRPLHTVKSQYRRGMDKLRLALASFSTQHAPKRARDS